MNYRIVLPLLFLLAVAPGCITVNQYLPPTTVPEPSFQPTPRIIYVTVQVTPVATDDPWVPVETLTVPAQGPAAPGYTTLPVTSVPLENGEIYRIRAGGTYSYGIYEPYAIADAEWIKTEKPADPGTVNGSWYQGEDIEPWLDLTIDEQDADWGSYQPDHVYTKIISGKGRPISFRIRDCCLDGREGCYADNGGYLTVSISRLA